MQNNHSLIIVYIVLILHIFQSVPWYKIFSHNWILWSMTVAFILLKRILHRYCFNTLTQANICQNSSIKIAIHTTITNLNVFLLIWFWFCRSWHHQLQFWEWMFVSLFKWIHFLMEFGKNLQLYEKQLAISFSPQYFSATRTIQNKANDNRFKWNYRNLLSASV